jgi:hypothetical protein
VAPHAERYRGADFSGVALAQVRAGLDRLPLPQVELAQGLADDWSGVAPGEFELIVLNSIIQYFPGVDYLVKVLEGAVAAVAPGGAVFVGDVRSLPLLPAFHASVELHRSAGSLPAAELAGQVKRRVAEEEELVIDPAFFFGLRKRLPRISRVDVQLKRGCHGNEMLRFRYDVVLYVGEAAPRPAAIAWRDWSEEAMSRFALVKQSFDPNEIFNPGVKIPARGERPLNDIKYDPLLTLLPADSSAALARVERERAYAASRLELLDEASLRVAPRGPLGEDGAG